MSDRSGRSGSARPCWVDVPDGSDFTLANLPFGVATHPEWTAPHVVVAIGDHAVDCHVARLAGLLAGVDLPAGVFDSGSLNPLIALGRDALGATREAVARLLTSPTGPPAVRVVVPRRELGVILPITVADYVDFYSSEHHARNLGRILRPGENPLAPNWKRLPVSYHGRAGSVVVSGAGIRRPSGMVVVGESEPAYAPTTQLDVELEVGTVIGAPSRRGETVSADNADDHIAGLVLLNDWSARDIQAFEYRPLGPNLGKSFATSISGWLVTLDVLEPFRLSPPPQDPTPAPHLATAGATAFDIRLEILLSTPSMRDQGRAPVALSSTNFATMYWTIAQQLAHMTSNGAAARTGDLLGSGTVSGPDPESGGSFMELSRGGREPICLPNGERRAFLEDGDEVTLRGWAGDGDQRVGFGDVTGMIAPTAARAAS